MARYRRKPKAGDTVRDLRSKQIQRTSADLGSSSIDWDDAGDDGDSLDITVSDTTVAKYGHDGSRHGFLVPVTGGWVTVQEDAQTRADAAQAAAEAHADALNTAMDARMDTAESDINAAQSDITALEGARANHAARIAAIEGYLTLYYYFPDGPP